MGRAGLPNDDRIADAYRRWGYLQADLDPLGRIAPYRHPDIDAFKASGASGPAASAEAERWRAIYCGSIGVEFMQMPYPDRCRFVAERMEAPSPPPDRGRLLRRIAETELFERFLHQRFVGTKRYSLEGGAGVIPLLDAILDAAAGGGVEIVLVGMSHRGRLDVMNQIVGVPPAHLFSRFEDIEPRSVLGGGDLKYHKGATGTYNSASGRALHVHLVSNPSHLEAVDPVVMGRARAHQQRIAAEAGAAEAGSGIGRPRVLPVTLHGDAAFAGQGIAAETLNMSELPGYTVGGTIRIVMNNLIGFTTEPWALHSSRYASDVAKRLAIPILHVNGQDPEAIVRAGRLAFEYRAAFQTDVVIDLIGFRRYGHSEVDDPTTTQPLLYARIGGLPMLWEAYAERLGVPPDERAHLEEEIVGRYRAELDKSRAMTKTPAIRALPGYWDRYVGGRYDPALEVDTAVDAGRLTTIASLIGSVPAGFHLHPKVAKGLEQRLEMGRGARSIDWGMAEALAFGSLLTEGVPIRLTGQDTRRGTFNHRHAVLIDVVDGRECYPLRQVGADRDGGATGGPPVRFEVYDSPLSEAAPLGFEYGYSRDYPEALVLWEAQFGDFVNGAQVILDQFIAAGEDKWGLLSGLVMLLPHGYEGQGPEHSSARIERFLDLAGEDAIQVCQPSTAAQYFHLLRRQALRRWRKPLVVFTPKGMLRAPAACSALADLASGRFEPVLGDVAEGGQTAASGDAAERSEATRILFCSGKIAHELRAERRRRAARGTAIVTVEQFYPFPETEVVRQLVLHPRAHEIVWVQEEPRNMGALDFVRPPLQRLADSRQVTAVHRSESASPATGSAKAHGLEQEALLALAIGRPGPV